MSYFYKDLDICCQGILGKLHRISSQEVESPLCFQFEKEETLVILFVATL